MSSRTVKTIVVFCDVLAAGMAFAVLGSLFAWAATDNTRWAAVAIALAPGLIGAAIATGNARQLSVSERQGGKHE